MPTRFALFRLPTPLAGLVAALGVAWMSSCAPRAPQLRFDAAAAPRQTKQFELKVQMSLDALELERDGVADSEPAGLGARVESVDELVFEDERLAASGDGLGPLVRRFAKVEGLKRHVRTDEFGEHVDERRKASPLAGLAVRFEPLPGSGAWRASFVEAGADERLLGGLEEDTDLRAFLSGAPLETGLRWKVSAAALGALLHPGGDLELAAEEDSASARESQAQLRKNLAGEIEVIFWGLRELSGRTFAVMQLLGEAQTHAETSETHVDMVVTQRFELARRVDGELVWDLAAGRAHTARLECKLTLRSISRQTRTDDLTPRVIERRATFGGQSRTDARFSPRD